MKEALDGLRGVRHTATDLNDDRFDVVYDPAAVSVDEMLTSIRDLGYTPTLVTSVTMPPPLDGRVVDRADLPPDLARLLDGANAASRAVLLRFTGPG